VHSKGKDTATVWTTVTTDRYSSPVY